MPLLLEKLLEVVAYRSISSRCSRLMVGAGVVEELFYDLVFSDIVLGEAKLVTGNLDFRVLQGKECNLL